MNFTDLPNDILQCICEECALPDLQSVSLTCKQSKDAVHNLLANSDGWCKLKLFKPVLTRLKAWIGADRAARSDFYVFLRSSYDKYCKSVPLKRVHNFFPCNATHVTVAKIFLQDCEKGMDDYAKMSIVHKLNDTTRSMFTLNMMYCMLKQYNMPTLVLPDKEREDDYFLDMQTLPRANKFVVKADLINSGVVAYSLQDTGNKIKIKGVNHSGDEQCCGVMSISSTSTGRADEENDDRWFEMYMRYLASPPLNDAMDLFCAIDFMLHNILVMGSRAYVCPFCGCDIPCVDTAAYNQRQYVFMWNPVDVPGLFKVISDQGFSLWKHIERCGEIPRPEQPRMKQRLASTLSWSKGYFYMQMNMGVRGLKWDVWDEYPHEEFEHDPPDLHEYGRSYVNDAQGNCVSVNYMTKVLDWFPDKSMADVPAVSTTYKDHFMSLISKESS